MAGPAVDCTSKFGARDSAGAVGSSIAELREEPGYGYLLKHLRYSSRKEKGDDAKDTLIFLREYPVGWGERTQSENPKILEAMKKFRAGDCSAQTGDPGEPTRFAMNRCPAGCNNQGL
jgi:hypothetical protein